MLLSNLIRLVLSARPSPCTSAGEHRSGDVPCCRDRRSPHPGCREGVAGGASRAALTAGRHRKSEGPGGKAGKEVVKSV